MEEKSEKLIKNPQIGRISESLLSTYSYTEESKKLQLCLDLSKNLKAVNKNLEKTCKNHKDHEACYELKDDRGIFFCSQCAFIYEVNKCDEIDEFFEENEIIKKNEINDFYSNLKNFIFMLENEENFDDELLIKAKYLKKKKLRKLRLFEKNLRDASEKLLTKIKKEILSEFKMENKRIKIKKIKDKDFFTETDKLLKDIEKNYHKIIFNIKLEPFKDIMKVYKNELEKFDKNLEFEKNNKYEKIFLKNILQQDKENIFKKLNYIFKLDQKNLNKIIEEVPLTSTNNVSSLKLSPISSHLNTRRVTLNSFKEINDEKEDKNKNKKFSLDLQNHMIKKLNKQNCEIFDGIERLSKFNKNEKKEKNYFSQKRKFINSKLFDLKKVDKVEVKNDFSFLPEISKIENNNNKFFCFKNDDKKKKKTRNKSKIEKEVEKLNLFKIEDSKRWIKTNISSVDNETFFDDNGFDSKNRKKKNRKKLDRKEKKLKNKFTEFYRSNLKINNKEKIKKKSKKKSNSRIEDLSIKYNLYQNPEKDANELIRTVSDLLNKKVKKEEKKKIIIREPFQKNKKTFSRLNNSQESFKKMIEKDFSKNITDLTRMFQKSKQYKSRNFNKSKICFTSINVKKNKKKNNYNKKFFDIDFKNFYLKKNKKKFFPTDIFKKHNSDFLKDGNLSDLSMN